MIIRCIANKAQDLPADCLNKKAGFSTEVNYRLKINQLYIVYGMYLVNGYIWYFIANEAYDYYPMWYPCPLFEIVDNQLSKYWIYSFIQIQNTSKTVTRTIWTYPEWANYPEHYDFLTDGEPTAVNIFKTYKNLMDLEFPRPDVEKKAIAMADYWLFCEDCIDAWQSFSKDGMVICPTCNQMMHNPNYISPLQLMAI